MPTKEISECQFHQCNKPIGHDSKEAGWVTCSLHRNCIICGLPLQPKDARIAFDRFSDESIESDNTLELIHPRCAIVSRRLEHLESDPTLSIKQSTFNLLNASRLMVDPDMALSIATNENNAMLRSREFCTGLLETSNPSGTPVHLMVFDAIYAHQKMLEACLAAVSLLVAKQDRPAIKARADAREAVAFKKATQESKTSTRPAAKKPDDNTEVKLSAFMELFQIKERKIAQDLKRRRDKAIDAFVKCGVSQSNAITMANETLIKDRNLKK